MTFKNTGPSPQAIREAARLAVLQKEWRDRQSNKRILTVFIGLTAFWQWLINSAFIPLYRDAHDHQGHGGLTIAGSILCGLTYVLSVQCVPLRLWNYCAVILIIITLGSVVAVGLGTLLVDNAGHVPFVLNGGVLYLLALLGTLYYLDPYPTAKQ
jgi:hypothetical protein